MNNQLLISAFTLGQLVVETWLNTLPNLSFVSGANCVTANVGDAGYGASITVDTSRSVTLQWSDEKGSNSLVCTAGEVDSAEDFMEFVYSKWNEALA